MECVKYKKRKNKQKYFFPEIEQMIHKNSNSPGNQAWTYLPFGQLLVKLLA